MNVTACKSRRQAAFGILFANSTSKTCHPHRSAWRSTRSSPGQGRTTNPCHGKANRIRWSARLGPMHRCLHRHHTHQEPSPAPNRRTQNSVGAGRLGSRSSTEQKSTPLLARQPARRRRRSSRDEPLSRPAQLGQNIMMTTGHRNQFARRQDGADSYGMTSRDMSVALPVNKKGRRIR
jgi:hypothetical protein